MTHHLLAQTLNFKQAAQDQGLPGGEKGATVGGAISNLMTALMAIAVLAVFIYLVTAAFEWITAGGEKGKIESARNKITGAIIGLVILASVFVMIMIIQNFLGIHVFSFGNAAPAPKLINI